MSCGAQSCLLLQAVMASDFALGQFRFLATLLLIHGQQSYRRISLVIGYATVLCQLD